MGRHLSNCLSVCVCVYRLSFVSLGQCQPKLITHPLPLPLALALARWLIGLCVTPARAGRPEDRLQLGGGVFRRTEIKARGRGLFRGKASGGGRVERASNVQTKAGAAVALVLELGWAVKAGQADRQTDRRAEFWLTKSSGKGSSTKILL